MPRTIPPVSGQLAVAAWLGGEASASERALAVRYTLQVLAERAPGRAVEVRVPPLGAVQAVAGPSHTRGTPPGIVETDPETWLALATGTLAWDAAVTSGRVTASGARADLAAYLPLYYPVQL
ncbi:MAG: sterol carrier family protein [Promicromonosporaceae bacterium]|nr:sterol carrier family protein [Promicromonosporaceae bacterium]